MKNLVILIGNLGQDPEIRATDNGTKVCKLSLATSESWKNREGEKEVKTTWHNVVSFGKLAEICEKFLRKGSKVYLEGKIDNYSYDKDGIKMYGSQIIMNELLLLDNKPSSESSPYEAPKQGSYSDDPNITDGLTNKLPF